MSKINILIFEGFITNWKQKRLERKKEHIEKKLNYIRGLNDLEDQIKQYKKTGWRGVDPSD